MKIICAIIISCMACILPATAQKDTIRYEAAWAGVLSDGKYAPFWQQSDRYGTILSSPNSTTAMASVFKNTEESRGKLKYGYKATLLLQTGAQETRLYFHELYLQGRFSAFDLTIGAREEHLGSQDSTLSCGGMLFSANARPMPKITLGAERFTPLPFSGGWLEAKGAIAHGWFTDNVFMKNVYLHHLYGYLRVGGRLPVHLSYGAEHVAQWGGYNDLWGQQPDKLSDFVRILRGKQGGKNADEGDQINALGNHIISQSLKLEAEWKGFQLSAYWQNISEDGPITLIGTTMNTSDGLWGVSLKNKRFSIVKGILYEYLRTTDQSGPYHDKDGIVYGGTDGYYFNGVYQMGWNYDHRTIGTPFISSPLYNSNGATFTLNSRVEVHHFGVEGNAVGCNYKALASFSKNYGAYYAPLPRMIKNSSLLLEANRVFPRWHHIEVGCSFAADFGKLYGNSLSGMITLRKRGILAKY